MIILPQTPHLPGRTPRPDPAGFATLRGDPEAAWRAGIEAFERGYFWEAHECWEGVWASCPPASRSRHLMQGLIQLANAGLKRRMGKDRAAARILMLADAALARAGDETMGMARASLVHMRHRAGLEIAL